MISIEYFQPYPFMFHLYDYSKNYVFYSLVEYLNPINSKLIQRKN